MTYRTVKNLRKNRKTSLIGLGRPYRTWKQPKFAELKFFVVVFFLRKTVLSLRKIELGRKGNISAQEGRRIFSKKAKCVETYGKIGFIKLLEV